MGSLHHLACANFSLSMKTTSFFWSWNPTASDQPTLRMCFAKKERKEVRWHTCAIFPSGASENSGFVKRSWIIPESRLDECQIRQRSTCGRETFPRECCFCPTCQDTSQCKMLCGGSLLDWTRTVFLNKGIKCGHITKTEPFSCVLWPCSSLMLQNGRPWRKDDFTRHILHRNQVIWTAWRFDHRVYETDRSCDDWWKLDRCTSIPPRCLRARCTLSCASSFGVQPLLCCQFQKSERCKWCSE